MRAVPARVIRKEKPAFSSKRNVRRRHDIFYGTNSEKSITMAWSDFISRIRLGLPMKKPDGKNISDILLVIFFYGAAFLVYFTSSEVIKTMENQSAQSTILLMICFVLSLLLLFFRHPLVHAVLFLLSFILILVNGILQGTFIWMEVLTAQCLIFLLVRQYHTFINICCSAAVMIGMGMTQGDLLIFEREITGPDLSSLLFLEFVLLFTLILSNMIKTNRQRIGVLRADLTGREKTIAHLTDANRDFQKFAIDVEEESRMDERLRISRDIHDITGYTLTGLSMMLEHAEDLLFSDHKEELAALLTTARDQARKGHEEIRKSLKMLRAIDDTKPFYSSVLHIVQNFESATGVGSRVDFTNMSVKMNKLGESVVYRFLQEGITNAFRHGKATFISIMFFQEEKNLVISLEDNGIGSDTIQEGIGLQGMKERIEKLNGAVRYGSTSIGFNLVARIPLNSIKGIKL